MSAYELSGIAEGIREFGYQSAVEILGYPWETQSEWTEEEEDKIEALQVAYIREYGRLMNDLLQRTHESWIYSLEDGETYSYDDNGEEIRIDPDEITVRVAEDVAEKILDFETDWEAYF